VYNGIINMKDEHFIDKHALSICAALTILALVFIVFGHKNRESVQLALTKKLVGLPATTVDLWSVSHLLLFMAFGLLIPNRHVSFLLAGATWEIVEDMLSSDETTQCDDCKTPDSRSKIMCKFSINDGYWYAKWDDVLVDLLGYTIGSAIRTTLFK
jgi:uncharacterized integral membrane protein